MGHMPRGRGQLHFYSRAFQGPWRPGICWAIPAARAGLWGSANGLRPAGGREGESGRPERPRLVGGHACTATLSAVAATGRSAAGSSRAPRRKRATPTGLSDKSAGKTSSTKDQHAESVAKHPEEGIPSLPQDSGTKPSPLMRCGAGVGGQRAVGHRQVLVGARTGYCAQR
jgi:hypothetical protein